MDDADHKNESEGFPLNLNHLPIKTTTTTITTKPNCELPLQRMVTGILVQFLKFQLWAASSFPQVSSVQVCAHQVTQSCQTLRPHGLWPTRLLCPWGFSRQEHWSGLPCPQGLNCGLRLYEEFGVLSLIFFLSGILLTLQWSLMSQAPSSGSSDLKDQRLSLQRF